LRGAEGGKGGVGRGGGESRDGRVRGNRGKGKGEE